jgi:hypothetical protein
MQKSVSPRIFVSKKGMICVRPMDVCTRNLRQKVVSVLLRETSHAVLKIWGRMYDILPHSAKGTRNGTRNRIPVQPRKGAIKLVSSDYAKILE